MRALLTMHPPAENERCTVFLAAGAAWDGGVPDAQVLGARLLPWFAERGARVSQSGADIDGPCRDHMTGSYFGRDDGRAAGAWVVPRADDLYLLACVRTPAAGEQRPPGLWSPADMVHTNMGAMALRLEFLPTEEE